MKTEIETITPEIAKEYLLHNRVNRVLRNRAVEELMRDMKAGAFKLTHQGIAFDKEGSLVDGQHRLTAIALSGCTVKRMVTRGLDEDCPAEIDTGKVRSYRDYCVFAESDDHPAMRHTKTIAAVRQIVRYGYKGNYDLTNNQMKILMHTLREKIIQVYEASATRGTSVTAAMSSAALAALLCGESYDAIHAFFSAYTMANQREAEGYNETAAFVWANTVMNAKAKRQPLTREKIYAGTQNAIWNFIHGDATKRIGTPKKLRYPVDILMKSILEGIA